MWEDGHDEIPWRVAKKLLNRQLWWVLHHLRRYDHVRLQQRLEHWIHLTGERIKIRLTLDPRRIDTQMYYIRKVGLPPQWFDHLLWDVIREDWVKRRGLYQPRQQSPLPTWEERQSRFSPKSPLLPAPSRSMPATASCASPAPLSTKTTTKTPPKPINSQAN